MTGATRTPRPARVPACHPERPHVARGMCRACYRADWGATPAPLRPSRRWRPPAAPTGDRTSLERALEAGDYWRLRCAEEALTLRQQIADALEAVALLQRGAAPTAVGALLLEVARGSQDRYVLVRQGQRRRGAPGTLEWRVSVRVIEQGVSRERAFAGRALVDALTRAAEALGLGAKNPQPYG